MISLRVVALMAQTTQMRDLLGKLVPKSYLFPAPYVTVITQIKQLIQESKLTKAAVLSVLDPSGQANILHVAVLYHDLPLVKWLLQQGAKVTSCNTKRETPLHWAVKEKQYEIMNELLMEDVRVDQKDALGRSPLHWAAKTDNFFASLLLLQHGANPLLEDICKKNSLYYFEKYFFLHTAIEKKDVKRVTLLLKAGVCVNLLDQDGMSALHLAIETRSLKCIALLLESGACTENLEDFFEEYEFLHYAVTLNDVRCVKALLKAGVDINAQDDFGNTPLYIAAEEENLEMAALLLDYGADFDIANIEGESPRDVLESKGLCDELVLLGLEQLECSSLSTSPVVAVQFSTVPPQRSVRQTRSEQLPDGLNHSTERIQRSKTVDDLTRFGLD